MDCYSASSGNAEALSKLDLDLRGCLWCLQKQTVTDCSMQLRTRRNSSKTAGWASPWRWKTIHQPGLWQAMQGGTARSFNGAGASRHTAKCGSTTIYFTWGVACAATYSLTLPLHPSPLLWGEKTRRHSFHCTRFTCTWRICVLPGIYRHCSGCQVGWFDIAWSTAILARCILCWRNFWNHWRTTLRVVVHCSLALSTRQHWPSTNTWWDGFASRNMGQKPSAHQRPTATWRSQSIVTLHAAHHDHPSCQRQMLHTGAPVLCPQTRRRNPTGKHMATAARSILMQVSKYPRDTCITRVLGMCQSQTHYPFDRNPERHFGYHLPTVECTSLSGWFACAACYGENFRRYVLHCPTEEIHPELLQSAMQYLPVRSQLHPLRARRYWRALWDVSTPWALLSSKCWWCDGWRWLRPQTSGQK